MIEIVEEKKTQEEKVIEILDDPRVWIKETDSDSAYKIIEFDTRSKWYYASNDIHMSLTTLKNYYSYSLSHRGPFKPLSEV